MKDPAVLFFIDTWLSATAEMDSDTKGWYLDLILHQYDKKDLPNDIENLAKLAGVKFSEYERFKQVFEQIKQLIHDYPPETFLKRYCTNTGESHWNWKGGITPKNLKIRLSSKYIKWRIKVFIRDKYICQNCGQEGGILHAHHIKRFSKYPELRTDVDNGITLCKKCHNQIHKSSKHGTT